VTERNKIPRPLCRHDPGQSRNAEDIALGGKVLLNELGSGRIHPYNASRAGLSLRHALAAHIDHVRFSAGIDVRQFMLVLTVAHSPPLL
jgi:hypothetical protein